MSRVLTMLRDGGVLHLRVVIYAAVASLLTSAYLYEIAFLKAQDVAVYFLILTLACTVVILGQLILFGISNKLITHENKKTAIGLTLSLAIQSVVLVLLVFVRHSPVLQHVLHHPIMLPALLLVVVVASNIVAVRIVRRLPGAALLDKIAGRASTAPPVLGLVVLALLLFGGGSPTSDKNIVIVTVDSWRFDSSGFRNEGIKTGNVDTLHRVGVTFDNFYAHAPYTWTSLSSIMTSMNSPHHEVRVNGQVLNDKFTTLAEVLRDEGYDCFASSTDIDLRLMGLHQGFKIAFAKPKELALQGLYVFNRGLSVVFPAFFEKYCFGPNNSLPTTIKALEFLRASKSKKHFLWMHYYDEPHLPYITPNYFYELYNKGKSSWVDGSKEMIHALTGSPSHAHLIEGKTLSEQDLEYFKNLYLAEVTAMDRQLGMVMDALRKHKLMQRTLLILTSDHGEDFSERGQFSHGHNLYAGLIHVPMVMRMPDGIRRKIESMGRGIDIAPTVVSFAGVDKPESFIGSDLLPLLKEDVPESREAWCFSECLIYGMEWPRDAYAFSYTSDRFKYIGLPVEEHEELYDLEADPHETTNIAASHPEEIAKLKAHLRKSFAIDETLELVPMERIVIDEKQRKMLRALGYIND